MAKRSSKSRKRRFEGAVEVQSKSISGSSALSPAGQRWYDPSSQRSLLVVGAMLSLIVALVFLPLLGNQFVKWDDDITLYKNPRVQGLDFGRLSWMFTDLSTMRYKPLAWVSLALIHSVSGLNPFGYHFVSLLFHCGNTVLLFLVLRKLMQMTKRAGFDSPTILSVVAGVTALLWALNPLRVEAVARVTDMTYCQSLFLVLISLQCYLKFVEGELIGRVVRRRWYWCSVGAFALAMATYPFVFAYPAILLLLDYYLLGRFDKNKVGRRSSDSGRIWQEKVPFLLFSGLLLITLYGRLNPPEMWKEQLLPDHLSAFAKAMQAFYIWAYFAWKPFVPFELSPVYTTLVSFNPRDWQFLASALFVLGLTGLLFWKRRRWPVLWVIWICHLLLLIPGLGLTEHPHYASDRYSYIQGILWVALLAGVLLTICQRPKVFVPAVVVVLMLTVGLATMSARQVRVWHDSITLFEYVISKLGSDPYSADIRGRLGDYYLELGKLDEAIVQYQQIIPFMPNNPNIRNNVGTLLMMQGRLDEAHAELRKAVDLDPKGTNLRKNLADVLGRQGRVQDAISQLEEALRLAPNDAEAHSGLGQLLMKQGQVDNAIYHFREAVRLQPQNPQARSNLELALRAKQGAPP